MIQKLMDFFKDEERVTAVEYGIMVAATAAVIISVLILVGEETNRTFDYLQTEMQNLPGS